jgi:hypothetical protein
MTPAAPLAILAMPIDPGSKTMTEREILFRTKRPQIDPAEALQMIREHGEIVSMGGREAAGDLFLLTFVSEKDTKAGPLALNPVVARELCKLLIDRGYGPTHTHQSQ